MEPAASASPLLARPAQDAARVAAEYAASVLRRLSERKQGHARYRLEGEIDRGGQGAVLRVWDDDLQRPLAMKAMHGTPARSGETPAAESRALARFFQEAQVTGQLDHPGVVPVHEIGLDDQGGIFFTMKLVRGEDLRAIFEKVKEGLEGWTEARAMGVFLKVCEAMAYAHAKGVVHRDLKPGNVMVGRYGEVHVMDWGLARVLAREDHRDLRISKPDESTRFLTRQQHASETSDSPLMTMDGHIVGTPCYMPPEQALGRLDELGPHSDVYAVGAMLYQLLAGHAPYLKPGMRLTSYAIWYKLQEGPPDSLHERAPRAPAELVAICERAMARSWRERYADMGALADDLRAYLEHRVVKAYRVGAWFELRKWIERNKGMAASIAAAILLLVLGLTVSLAFKLQSDHHALLARENEQRALDGEALASREAERASQEADTARRTSDFLIDLFTVVDPGEARGSTVTAREILDRGASRIEAELREAPEVRASLLDTMGVVYSRLGLYQAAQPLLREALEERLRVLGEEDVRVAESRNNLGATLLKMASYDGAESELRAALELRLRLLGAEPATAQSQNDLATLLCERGRWGEAEELARESLELRRKLLGRHAAVAESLDTLAFALTGQNEFVAVEGLLREALELRTELLSLHPATAESLSNLGAFLYEQKHQSEAIPLFQQSLDMKREIYGAVHPEVALGMNNLAIALHDMGDLDGAEALYRAALGQQRALLGGVHPDVGQALNNLAFVLKDRGDYEGARACFFESVTVYRRALGDEHPSTRNAESNARRLVTEAIEQRAHEWGGEHPETLRARLDLAEFEQLAGRPGEARPIAEEAWILSSEGAEAEGALAARAASVLGAVLADLGELGEAEELLDAGFTRLLASLGPGASEARAAGERLVALYERTDRPEEAARVRDLLAIPAPGGPGRDIQVPR